MYLKLSYALIYFKVVVQKLKTLSLGGVRGAEVYTEVELQPHHSFEKWG